MIKETQSSRNSVRNIPLAHKLGTDKLPVTFLHILRVQ